MSIKMAGQSTPGGSITALDLGEEGLSWSNFKLAVSDSHPARLSWRMYAPQQTTIAGLIRNFVIFWDDELTNPATESPYSQSEPIFEGYVEEIQPVASNVLEFVAFDPTRKAANEITIFSFTWEEGTPPTRAVGALPRLVFNSTIDNDDDYTFERARGQTVGEIIQTLLDDQYFPLEYANCARDDSAYVAADLEALDYEPQSKVVFESENIRSGVYRLLALEPEMRMVWHPGDSTNGRLWRFYNVKNSPAVTLTLNDHETEGAKRILSLELTRSLEGRYTSVKFYGPPQIITTEVEWPGDGLTLLSTCGQLQNDLVSCCNVSALCRWQVTDPDWRRGARYLASAVNIPVLAGQWGSTNSGVGAEWFKWIPTRTPAVVATFPDTTGGSDHPVSVSGWTYDPVNGIVDFSPNALYRYNSVPDSGEPDYENPETVKFIYGRYTDPLTARYPAEDYDGTAYTIAGLENELSLYDESLAVDYLWDGTTITTEKRLEQFAKLAEKIHSYRKDIVYAGGVVIDGIDADFFRLNKRVNLAGQDANGDSIPTGWEAIGAQVTDAEFDWETMQTTLTFSADQMELIGRDVEDLKERLQIRALEPVYQVFYFVDYQTRTGKTDWGTHVVGQDITIMADVTKTYIDPVTGEQG